MMRTLLLAMAMLAACKDDDSRDDEGSSSTGPNFTVCTECPIGGPPVCPEGQVCASILPGSGGVCMLTCADDGADPCVFDGIVTSTCKAFSQRDARV